MAVSAELLQSHIGYTTWASGLLVEAAGQLTQEGLTPILFTFVGQTIAFCGLPNWRA